MKYSPSEFHDSSRWRLMFLCSKMYFIIGLKYFIRTYDGIYTIRHIFGRGMLLMITQIPTLGLMMSKIFCFISVDPGFDSLGSGVGTSTHHLLI